MSTERTPANQWVDPDFDAFLSYDEAHTQNHTSSGEKRVFSMLLLSIRLDVMTRGFAHSYMNDMIDFLAHVDFICDMIGLDRDAYLNNLLMNWRKGNERATRKKH